MPRFSRDASPNKRGSSAVACIWAVPEIELSPLAWARSGPTTSQLSTNDTATQLSMMVLMTSCTPRRSLSQAGPAAYRPPATAAARRHNVTCRPAGHSNPAPTTAAARAPTINWPCAPMLNNPTRNASATDSPVKVSSAALLADSPSGRATTAKSAPSNHLGQSPRAPQVMAANASKATPKPPRVNAVTTKQITSADTIDSTDGSAAASPLRIDDPQHGAADAPLVVGPTLELLNDSAFEHHEHAV